MQRASPLTTTAAATDEGEHSPEFMALQPRQQEFVRLALDFPHLTNHELARRAGYSNKSEDYLRVTGHRLSHDSKVLAAFHAEAQRRLRAGAVLGASVIAEIARDVTHKDRLKAAGMLLNRIGLHERTEHKTTVEHSVDAPALIERIKAVAAELGIDPQKLLGQVDAPKQLEPPPIDVEFTEVRPDAPASVEGLEDVL